MGAFAAAALEYAVRGWRVVPLRPGLKRPWLDAWQKRATTRPDIIAKWAAAKPDAGVGIRTGPDTVWVVDVDTKNGADLKRVELEDGGHCWRVIDNGTVLGDLPAGRVVRTPSGGWHVYLRGHERVRHGDLSRSGAVEMPHQVAAPPTVTERGQYELVEDTDELPPPPSWMFSRGSPRRSRSRAPTPDSRNKHLHRRASLMRAAGLNPDVIDRELQAELHRIEEQRIYPKDHAVTPDELRAIRQNVTRRYRPDRAPGNAQRVLQAQRTIREWRQGVQGDDWSGQAGPANYALLMALYDRASQGGRLRVQVDDRMLAEMTGMNRKTVRKARWRLEAAKYLVVERVGAGLTATTYRLVQPPNVTRMVQKTTCYGKAVGVGLLGHPCALSHPAFRHRAYGRNGYRILLAFAGRRSYRTMRALSAASGVRYPTVRRNVRKLEASGILERVGGVWRLGRTTLDADPTLHEARAAAERQHQRHERERRGYRAQQRGHALQGGILELLATGELVRVDDLVGRLQVDPKNPAASWWYEDLDARKDAVRAALDQLRAEGRAMEVELGEWCVGPRGPRPWSAGGPDVRDSDGLRMAARARPRSRRAQTTNVIQ